MASPGNQHCANCIGTLSFPTFVYNAKLPFDAARSKDYVTVGCPSVRPSVSLIDSSNGARRVCC